MTQPNPFGAALMASIEHARIGQTRTCPDCGRPQHYTGTEYGWAHDALVDTWHCADPKHVSLLGRDGA